MNLLTVKSVFYCGEEVATVTLESKRGVIEAFCHPCTLKEGDKVINLLNVLECEIKAAFLDDWPTELKLKRSKESLEKIGSYSYSGVGQLNDPEKGILTVMGFNIEVDTVPAIGPVEFKIDRLDLRQRIYLTSK